MASPTIDLVELHALVDRGLAVHLERVRARLSRIHPALDPLADELAAFVLSGGKRLRPSLLLLGFAAAGGQAPERALGPALSLELLHSCALLHDDIIDAAPTRRGRTTTHVRFADLHLERGWAGDRQRFGEGVAILLGDLAFTQADELFLSAEVPSDRLLDAFRRFTLLREEVMAGQYLDVYAATSRTTSRDLALAVATFKSGRYTIARPLEIGACLAGAPDDLVEGLRGFGDPLGRAFQVRDDVLGVFGDEGATGKSVASDLAEGKRTLLVAETLDRLATAEATEFEGLLGAPDLTADDADRLRAWMSGSGGLEAATDYIAEATGEARERLELLEIPDDARGALRRVVAMIGQREA